MDVQALNRSELHEFPFSAQEHISHERHVYSKTRSGTVGEDAGARIRPILRNPLGRQRTVGQTVSTDIKCRGRVGLVNSNS